jgi:hypothetical protein
MQLQAKPDFSNVVIFEKQDPVVRSIQEKAVAIAELTNQVEKIRQEIRRQEMELREKYKLAGLDQISYEQECAIQFERPAPSLPEDGE